MYESPQRSARGGRVRFWALGLPVLMLGLILTAFLVLGTVGKSIALPTFSDPIRFVDRTLSGVLATATPTPAPTPTLAPSQLAAQFVPQLRDALSGANWDRALEIVTIMHGVDPSGEAVLQWAFTTHMQYGQNLVTLEQESQALVQFDEAVELAPDDAEARLWQSTTQMYLGGREALAAGKWDEAIEAFTLAHEQLPDYSDLFARLVESYRLKGQAALDEQDWTLAIEALIQAHDRMPKDPDLIDLLSQAYRGQARQEMTGEDWTAAIEILTVARERLPSDVPSDAELVNLLASAYRQRGIAQQEAVKLKEAKADLEAALALRPNDAEAQSHLDRVTYLLSKRIEIDISQQRLYAWKGDSLVYKFPVSTGIRGRDTATGHFQVLDKIPMAYSRIWRLKMPYWMGIYWVQGIENGIHALPIRPDGSVMWGGLLGQKASYGCIILSNQAAKALYNWADIGTQVHIHN